MKVAITQRQAGYGGKLAVMTCSICVLNERGIIPDVLTFDSWISKEKIDQYFNRGVKFTVREIPSYIKLRGEPEYLWFNLLLKFYRREYDYFIDNNNTSFLMPRDIPILSYVHYPRKDRLLSPYVSLPQPEGKRKSWFRSPRDFHLKATALIYQFNKQVHNNNMVVCNSEFTRSRFLDQYPGYRRKVPVLYPPVAVKSLLKRKVAWSEKSNSVVTLGRFCENKRQLEQIHIAEQLPNCTFHLVGFVHRKGQYYAECQSYIKRNNVTNVLLHRNVSFREKMEIMRGARIFLHSQRNEPFGITTVEGILAGCLPIVHDSGGQREIVPVKALRYSSPAGAISIIERAFSKRIDTASLVKYLQEHILEYDEDHFCHEFRRVLDNFSEEYNVRQ